jgi:Phage-integrase repeat unit
VKAVKNRLSLKDLRDIIRPLNLKGKPGYEMYWKSHQRPDNIPARPDYCYPGEWNGWGDLTGYKRTSEKRRYRSAEDSSKESSENTKYRSFEDTRDFVRKLGLKSYKEWQEYRKSKNRPIDIPSDPYRIYKKKGWDSWGDFLGTGTIADQKRQFRSYKEAREFVRPLKLKNWGEWRQYCLSGNKPQDIPTNPQKIYKVDGITMGDFLGTGFVQAQKRKFRPFEEAREFMHKLGLKDQEEWFEYRMSGNKPPDIPSNPNLIYKNQWKDLADWLGYEGLWNTKRIKGLLRDLIKGRYIYDWSGAVLEMILHTKGVLNLSLDGNIHGKFMRDLVSASRTPEGLKAIEDYAFSDSEEPPNLSAVSLDKDAEIGTASSEELAQLVWEQQDADEKIITAKQILAQTNLPESISVDEETMRFLLYYNVLQLWKNAFRDHGNKSETTIDAVKEEGMNGNSFHDEVIQTFLSDFQGAKAILADIPDGYSFAHPKTGKILPPTLMQGYIGYKIKTQPFFGNFSSVGTGKTLSAILASRVIGSKMTVVVCPNDLVNQWRERIIEAFPDSYVITDRDKAFNAKYDGSRHQYLVLNYDKFSQDNSQRLIGNLVKEKN